MNDLTRNERELYEELSKKIDNLKFVRFSTLWPYGVHHLETLVVAAPTKNKAHAAPEGNLCAAYLIQLSLDEITFTALPMPVT